MSGDIYFGFDKSDPEKWEKNDGYVNSPTFAAFGELLDDALGQSHPSQLGEIKESQYQMMFNFCRLPAIDYNSVIRAIRTYVDGLKAPTAVQQDGIWVWREMAEPFIRKDERYDFEFHGEVKPPQV
jgi:hypothetical protein